MNLLFSRLLRDFIDRKHRFVAGSQVNDRAQRSVPPTVDFVPVVASKRLIERSLPISRYDYRNSSHWTDLSSFLPSFLFFFSPSSPSFFSSSFFSLNFSRCFLTFFVTSRSKPINACTSCFFDRCFTTD